MVIYPDKGVKQDLGRTLSPSQRQNPNRKIEYKNLIGVTTK